jgi:general secretion pathway protein M
MINYMLKYHVIKTWWLELKTREQNIIFCSTILTLLLLYFAIIIAPLSNKIESLKKETAEDQQLNLWMTQSIDKISKFHNIASIPIINHTSLLALIDQDAKAKPWGISVTEMKQINDNQVQVSLNNLDFDELITGIEQLWGKYTVQVIKISVQHSAPTNLVATVIFQ